VLVLQGNIVKQADLVVRSSMSLLVLVFLMLMIAVLISTARACSRAGRVVAAVIDFVTFAYSAG
jgi:drug/metabolite transporter superfamily protein YnfA